MHLIHVILPHAILEHKLVREPDSRLAWVVLSVEAGPSTHHC